MFWMTWIMLMIYEEASVGCVAVWQGMVAGVDHAVFSLSRLFLLPAAAASPPSC